MCGVTSHYLPRASCHRLIQLIFFFFFFFFCVQTTFTRTTVEMGSQRVITIRQYEVWVQPFPGEIILKNELCWAQYAPSKSPKSIERDRLWFDGHSLDMPMFYTGTVCLDAEEWELLWAQLFQTDPDEDGTDNDVGIMHGHAVENLRMELKTVHRSINPHDRPLN